MGEPQPVETADGWLRIGAVTAAVLVVPTWMVVTAILAELGRADEPPPLPGEVASSPPILLPALFALVVVVGLLGMVGAGVWVGMLLRRPARSPKLDANVLMTASKVSIRVRAGANAEPPAPPEPRAPLASSGVDHARWSAAMRDDEPASAPPDRPRGEEDVDRLFR
jgi:hypothetical protein